MAMSHVRCHLGCVGLAPAFHLSSRDSRASAARSSEGEEGGASSQTTWVPIGGTFARERGGEEARAKSNEPQDLALFRSFWPSLVPPVASSPSQRWQRSPALSGPGSSCELCGLNSTSGLKWAVIRQNASHGQSWGRAHMAGRRANLFICLFLVLYMQDQPPAAAEAVHP
jgi:hypothetical protein